MTSEFTKVYGTSSDPVCPGLTTVVAGKSGSGGSISSATVPGVDPAYGFESVTPIRTSSAVRASVTRGGKAIAFVTITDISGSRTQAGTLTLVETDPRPVGTGAGNDIRRNISKLGELKLTLN